jgi:hypothetical protein
MERLENSFDQNFMIVEGKFKYPYIVVEDVTEDIGLLRDSLGDGDLPLVILHNGEYIQIASIKCSPLILSRLLRLYRIIVVIAKDICYKVNNIVDLLEVSEFNWIRE